jgi:methionine synthase II (cobalamin-independent)
MATFAHPAALPTEPATSHLHLNPPHRAEHVGSLLRPAALLERRSQFDAKLCTPEELKEVEDAAIKDAVALQQELGMKTITDGEMRRYLLMVTSFRTLLSDTSCHSGQRCIL